MPRKIVARRSAIHGNGVFALVPIAKGERIIEYRGMLRTHEDVDAGESGAAESGHTFLFTLNDEYVIDGNFNGNVARWINHSCSPNCEAVLEEADGDDRRKDRVFIEAIRNVKPGDELFYNYGITLGEAHTPRMKKIWECRCGAKNCTGTMLQPKRKPKGAAAAKKVAKKTAKKAAETARTSTKPAKATKKSATKAAKKSANRTARA
jgi:SET domain-containing protein